jgi:hypothetical protein
VYVKYDRYQRDYEIYEDRIRTYVIQQMTNVHKQFAQHKEEVAKTASHFEEQVNLNQKDTLWKIAECEELLKTRITVQKTEQLL